MSKADLLSDHNVRIEITGVGKTYPDGTRALNDVSISVEPGEFIVLVGPSGCGKSTLLRSIAGLESVTDGEIKIGDKVVNDVAPQERDLAMVFQNYALYPHLTVLDNIAFPLRMRGVSRTERRNKARQTAELLDLGELLERKPGALSGGQRQRVAMGRALIRDPIAFLMDEPLSNLDAKLRGEMRIEIEDLHQRTGVTFIYVTHDQTEAMTMADRVVAMQPLSATATRNVAQIGTPKELYVDPENAFVAGFIGSPPMNLLEALVDTTSPVPCANVAGVKIPLPASPTGEHVLVGFRPQAVLLEQKQSTTVDLKANVVITEFLGSTTEIRFAVDGLSPVVSKLFVGQLPADAGTVERGRQQLFLDTSLFHFFDPISGANLARNRKEICNGSVSHQSQQPHLA